MKANCIITITGEIELPDCWADQKETKKNPYYPLEVADYHYNDKLTERETLEDLLGQMLCGHKGCDTEKTDVTVEFPPVCYHRDFEGEAYGPC